MKIKSPVALAIALALGNYLWYLGLNKAYFIVGTLGKKAVLFSFFTWLLCLPFTYWWAYYIAMKRLKSARGG